MPGPPPGAGVVLAVVSDLEVAAAAAGLGELFGLNKSARVFFGEAAGLAVGEAADAGVAIAVFLRAALDAGSVTGWVVAAGEALAAGEASAIAAAFSFLRDFFAGEADVSGLVPGEASAAVSSFFLRDFLAGDADVSAAGDSLAAGDASAAAFLRECFAADADADGVGDWALTTPNPSPITNSKAKNFVCIRRRLTDRDRRGKTKELGSSVCANQCCASGV